MRAGWKVTKLGDICRISIGGTPPRNIARYFDKSRTSGHVWLSIADLPIGKKAIVSNSKEYLSDEGAAQVRVVPAGTLLVSFKLTLGRLAFAGCDLRTNEAIAALCDLNEREVHREYLYWFLTYFDWEKAAEGEDKIKGKTLNKAKLERVDIFYPSLAKQKRIVAILDEAFEALAVAVAASTRAIAAADELFSIFQNTLLSGDEDWIEIPLGHVLSVKHGFAFESKYFGPDGNYVLLTPGNFYESGGFRDRGSAQKRYHGPMPAGFVLQAGMLLVAMTEQAVGLLGSPLLVPDGEAYLHNQRLGLIETVRGAQLDKHFLFHLFNTAAFRQHMHDSATGTKVRHTSPGKIEAFVARFPPTVEAQADLAARIYLMSNEIDTLREVHRRKFAALKHLKHSLLVRVFSGELHARAAPVAKDNEFSTPEQAANILAFMHWQHERSNRARFFGHVMAQKTLDLIERIACIELGRVPYKDAAGPNDRAHMAAAERWAKQQGFFEFVERNGGGYDLKKLSNHSVMLAAAQTALKPVEVQMAQVTDILVGKDTLEAEVFATTLAAWNNLVVDGDDASDMAIIHEARENWHPDKLAIPISKFRSAIKEIRQRGIVPDGTAKVVRHRQASLL